jgi:hypothetical protein
MKISSDTIGNRTRNLPVCSAVFEMLNDSKSSYIPISQNRQSVAADKYLLAISFQWFAISKRALLLEGSQVLSVYLSGKKTCRL